MNKVHQKSNTKETKKSLQLTEERIREIVKDEIHKWEKETFIPRLVEH